MPINQASHITRSKINSYGDPCRSDYSGATRKSYACKAVAPWTAFWRRATLGAHRFWFLIRQFEFTPVPIMFTRLTAHASGKSGMQSLAAFVGKQKPATNHPARSFETTPPRIACLPQHAVRADVNAESRPAWRHFVSTRFVGLGMVLRNEATNVTVPPIRSME